MSNEIQLGKLSANRSVDAESPIVVGKEKGKKKKNGQGALLLFLMAVGLGAVALTSITLLGPVTFYGYVGSPGSIDDDSGDRSYGGAVIPAVVGASSATAIDDKGTVIEDNGLTKSAGMAITGYSGQAAIARNCVAQLTHYPPIAVVVPLLSQGFLLEDMYSLS